MRALLYCIAFSFLLSSCSDQPIDESLLQPIVVKAKKFSEALKSNDKESALFLMHGDGEITTDANRSQYGPMFDDVYKYMHGHKLAPLNKWKVYVDFMTSKSGTHKVYIDDVMIPFEGSPSKPDDPVFLYVGFRKDADDDVREFGVLTKENTGNDGSTYNFTHMLSVKEIDVLNEVY